MKALTNYIKTSFEELTKVTWPTKNQAIRLSIIVLVSCSIIAVILGFLDILFNEIYLFLLNLNA